MRIVCEYCRRLYKERIPPDECVDGCGAPLRDEWTQRGYRDTEIYASTYAEKSVTLPTTTFDTQGLKFVPKPWGYRVFLE